MYIVVASLRFRNLPERPSQPLFVSGPAIFSTMFLKRFFSIRDAGDDAITAAVAKTWTSAELTENKWTVSLVG